MRVLDCGCGPGTITIGLAEAVEPGCVVGVDLQARYLAGARALAIQNGVDNLIVVAGSAYALPFADATFDAAFANSVLMHLRDPLAALRELRRVLTSRGIVGIRDADLSAEVVAPAVGSQVNAGRTGRRAGYCALSRRPWLSLR